MFDTLAPEMSGFNRVVLFNSGCSGRRRCANSQRAAHRGDGTTITALMIFNAGDKDNVLPGNAEATVIFRLIPCETQGA